jgi:GH25 family lysozyme M1 (1,4-beta-N-acetylmuramidase)
MVLEKRDCVVIDPHRVVLTAPTIKAVIDVALSNYIDNPRHSEELRKQMQLVLGKVERQDIERPVVLA